MKRQIKNRIDKQVDIFKNWLRLKLKDWLYPVYSFRKGKRVKKKRLKNNVLILLLLN